MLHAGVPMKKPVAGIAMGLITEGNDRYAILSDILGEEDHLGDMDFKVAGTADGITGFQMDIKIAGVSPEIMKNALAQAKEGRMHILGIMNQCISAPNAELSQYAPRVEMMTIPEDKIGALIGPGGKNVKAISDKYNVTINTENDGTVKKIMDFGAFVEILPGKEGLCHISKLSRSRVEKVSDVLKEGQEIPVKLLEIDKLGRLNLSYVDALEERSK